METGPASLPFAAGAVSVPVTPQAPGCHGDLPALPLAWAHGGVCDPNLPGQPETELGQSSQGVGVPCALRLDKPSI